MGGLCYYNDLDDDVACLVVVIPNDEKKYSRFEVFEQYL